MSLDPTVARVIQTSLWVGTGFNAVGIMHAAGRTVGRIGTFIGRLGNGLIGLPTQLNISSQGVVVSPPLPPQIFHKAVNAVPQPVCFKTDEIFNSVNNTTCFPTNQPSSNHDLFNNMAYLGFAVLLIGMIGLAFLYFTRQPPAPLHEKRVKLPAPPTAALIAEPPPPAPTQTPAKLPTDQTPPSFWERICMTISSIWDSFLRFIHLR